MFATPFTAWPAMCVKSGPPRGPVGIEDAVGRVGAAAGGSGSGAVPARESVAVRMRPVRTRPAMNPARSRTQESNSLRIMALQMADSGVQIDCKRPVDHHSAIQSGIGNLKSRSVRSAMSCQSCVARDVDSPRAAAAGFRQRQREESLDEIGRHAFDIDRFGEDEGARETPVAALDAMVLLAGDLSARALAAYHDAALFGVNLDLLAGESGEFGRQDKRAGGLVEIDRRRPSRRIGADELPDLFVQRQQIAQWIPPREGHIAS